MTNANTIISLSLVLLAIIITSTAIKSQRPALPFPFREENVEFLTSEEEERLIYGGNEKIIDEKIKDLPAERVMAPRPGPMARGDIIPGKPPVPTMDPSLPKMVKRPMEHPPKQFRKVPPPKSTRGFPFRIPRVFLKNGGARNITPLKRKPRMKNQMPIPTYRARPSTLVSSEPDQLEVAVKRVEIMAARAGLNMSSMPRRTQMQVMKKLMPKLPPRMSNMVKEAMDTNPEKMYSFLPEPMKDFQENGKDDLRDEFAESINQPVVHHHHGNSHHHGQSGVKNYDAEKISIAHNHDDAEDESSFSHLPMTENFENGPSSGLMPPSDLAGHGDYASDFSDRDFEREAQYTVPATRINHHHDPIASPLVSELSDPMMAEGSDHVPFVISPGSLSKNSKASKIVSALKSITPSPVRVNLPSKDKYQIHTTTRKPIRVSIISNGKSDSTVSPPPKQDPILKIIQIEQVPEDEDDLPAIIHEVKEQQQSDHVPNPDSTKIPFRPISLDIIRAEEDKYQIKEDLHKKEPQNSFNSMNKKENDFLFNVNNKKDKYTLEKTVPTTTLPITTTTTTTTTEKVTTTNPPSTTTTTTTTTEAPLDLSKLDMFDDWESQPEEQWSDPYDLTDDEIAATVAELKKYETQGYLDNSLEQDLAWRLTPHPLEYPDHPDHPKDSIEEIIKSESESSDNKNKGNNNNSNNNKPQPQTVSKRPNHPPGPPRRPGPPPPNVRRPPFRRPSGPPPMKRPPPPGPPNGGRRPPNPPLPPRRPPPRPMVINDVTVSEIPKEYSKECDYFSEDLCLVVQDYPIEAISEAMEQYSDASKLLVKEPDGAWVDGVPRSQENNYNFKHYFGQQRRNDDEMNSHRHRDFAGEGGFLCPSKVAYGQVKKARSSSNGDWKYVVNYGDNTQTLRLEKCLTPGNTCSYVMPHYRTACTQVYNYHRLLAWDSEKGLHVDVFKVPTCCTCHVQGYYIPQGQQGFTPAPRRPPRLNFSPPRTPMGRGGKKIPSSNTMIPTLLKPGLGVGKPVLSAPINEQTSPSPAATKELKDDLQDLLAQYSALRERIAKKKNTENVEVAYNVSSTSSNSTESLRPKTRESRTSQFPLKLKPLLQLKQLSEKLKKMKMKPTNISKPLLVKTSLKRPLARALLLAKLNRKIKAAKSAKVAKQNAATAAATRTSNARAMRTASGFPSGHSNTSSSSSSIKDRIQMLRSRLTKYNEKKPLPAKESISAAQKLREKSNRPPSGPALRPQQQQQHQSTQRSRLNNPKPQSKVNYSYHPIMDYFNSKKGKNAT